MSCYTLAVLERASSSRLSPVSSLDVDRLFDTIETDLGSLPDLNAIESNIQESVWAGRTRAYQAPTVEDADDEERRNNQGEGRSDKGESDDDVEMDVEYDRSSSGPVIGDDNDVRV